MSNTYMNRVLYMDQRTCQKSEILGARENIDNVMYTWMKAQDSHRIRTQDMHRLGIDKICENTHTTITIDRVSAWQQLSSTWNWVPEISRLCGWQLWCDSDLARDLFSMCHMVYGHKLAPIQMYSMHLPSLKILGEHYNKFPKIGSRLGKHLET